MFLRNVIWKSFFPNFFFFFFFLLFAAWKLCKVEFLISRLQKPCYYTMVQMWGKIVQLYFISRMNPWFEGPGSTAKHMSWSDFGIIKNCSELYNKVLMIKAFNSLCNMHLKVLLQAFSSQKFFLFKPSLSLKIPM